MSGTTEPGQRQVGGYILCYVLYVVLILLSLVMLAVWRLTILELIGAFIGPRVGNTAFFQLGVLFFGFVAFILVIAAEPYLRTGVKRGLLWSRFARLALPLIAVSVLGVLLQFVLEPQT